MRNTSLFASLLLIPLLAACDAPNEGAYDANGNWIAPPNAITKEQRNQPPSPGLKHYERAGYYDYNGYYVTVDQDVFAPRNMLPPRGMCRVWLLNRAPEYQPRVESCEGIQDRVPVGAYVIYGG
jgi:hypothetical protein